MYIPILLSRIMGCHRNHERSYNQNAYILGQYSLHLNGPIEKNYPHNKMSYVFNLCLITHMDSSLPNGFPSFISFH